MAKITQQPTVSVEAKFTFNEIELRALDGLVGYGADSFLEVFYKHLGTTYMKPHEAGLRTFFETIRNDVPAILKRTDDARKVFTGEKVARSPEFGISSNSPPAK